MAVTITDVAPDPVLTEIAQKYGEGGGYAQDRLLPSRQVARDQFKFMTWPLRDFLQGSQYDSRRAPGASSTKVRMAKGTWDTGTVHERSLMDELTDEVLGNAPNPAIYEEAMVRKIMNHLRLEIEVEIESLLTDTGTFANAVPGVKWDATKDVTIEANIDAGREAFIAACGFEPNTILFPPLVANVVKRSTEVRELRKYTDPTLAQNGGLGPMLWGLNIVVPGALEDEANPGASADIKRVWAQDKAILLYVNPAAATDPQAMTTITRYYSDASPGTPWAVRSWRDPDPSTKKTWYHVETFDEIKLTAAAGYILDDVLT